MVTVAHVAGEWRRGQGGAPAALSGLTDSEAVAPWDLAALWDSDVSPPVLRVMPRRLTTTVRGGLPPPPRARLSPTEPGVGVIPGKDPATTPAEEAYPVRVGWGVA